MAKRQVVSAADVKRLANIEGTGEIIQVLVAQCVITGGAVAGIAVAAGAIAPAAIEARSRASLDIVIQGMSPGIVRVELHPVVQPLTELRLQRVVIGIPLVRHLDDALPRGKRIRLEEIDGIGSGGR